MLESEFVEKDIIKHTKYSNVYLCYHIDMEVPVIIEKFNHPNGLPIAEDTALSEEIGRRKVLSNISTLQRTFHVIKRKDHTWFICENAGGNSLYDLIRDGPLPIQQARYMFFLMAYTLQELHSMNYAIKDFSPENFYFFTTMFKFTSYRDLVATGSYTNKEKLDWLNDIRWMSPESLQGGTYDIVKSNIYCIGLYLYSFLTGTIYHTQYKDGNIFENMKNRDLSLLEGKIDTKALNLLKLMFAPPDKRPTVKQILNHDFLKPRVPFPNYHPPLHIEDGVKEWLILFKKDPDTCLAELQDLNVSENTLYLNLAIIANSHGHKAMKRQKYTEKFGSIILPPSIEDVIEPIKSYNVVERKVVKESLSKREKRIQERTAEVEKLLDFCRKGLEERGIVVDRLITTPNIKNEKN